MEHPKNHNPNQNESGGIMEKRKIRTIQSLLIILILTLMVAVLGVSPAMAAEKKMVTDPTTGEMVNRSGVWRDIDLCSQAGW